MGRKRKSKEALETSTRDLLQHWNEYYTNTNFGIGVQCSRCQKWRLTYQYQESKDVPTDWNCSMWKINKKKRGNCSIHSNLTEADFAREDYPPGTVVWAKLSGFPWWPAMVEDSPDAQAFFMTLENGKEAYHVTFFGKSSKRSWIKASHIREFAKPPPDTAKASKPSLTLKKSIEQAKEAAKLPIKERLMKYSFAARYNGRWVKLKEKDNVVLPPVSPGRKRFSKPAEIKPPVKNDNRSANGNDQLTSATQKRKRVCGSKKKVGGKKQEMDASEDHSYACPADNNSKVENAVDAKKKKPAEQNHQTSSGDSRVQKSETTVIIRKDVVGHFKCYQSYEVHKYTRRDSNTKSTVTGARNEVYRLVEDDVSADDEDSEDCDCEEKIVDGTKKLYIPTNEDSDREDFEVCDDEDIEVCDDEDIVDCDREDIEGYDRVEKIGDGTRKLSIPAPSFADFDDSTITIFSSDDEVEEEPPWQKAYREFIAKKYPSFIGHLLSGSSKEQMVVKT